MPRQAKFKLVLTSLLLTIVVVWVNAGNLTPPGGPVSGTMKTLSEVEPRTLISTLPFTINSPGSYYLIKDLTGTSGQHGITIMASDVSLDLCGFTVRGTAGSLDGIYVSGAHSKIDIRNGIVQGWGGGGVNTGSGMKVMLAMMKAEDNSYGTCTGDDTYVAYMMADNNDGDGLTLGDKCVCDGAAVCGNGAQGIEAGAQCNILNCVATLNLGGGIQVGDSNTIKECTLAGNTGVGLAAGSGCTIRECTASGNSTDGIRVGSGTMVNRCTTRANLNDGIQAAGDCYIVENLCIGNGPGANDGAGIHIITPGGGTRVEANNVSGNDRGIDVDSTNNVIIRNTARAGGLPYDIVSGNTVGSVTSAVGNDNFTSTNCWANLIY